MTATASKWSLSSLCSSPPCCLPPLPSLPHLPINRSPGPPTPTGCHHHWLIVISLMGGRARVMILSSLLLGFAASFCAHMKKHFFKLAHDFSVGVSAKKKPAMLKHHPGQLWCSNVAIIDDSIMDGKEFPPWSYHFGDVFISIEGGGGGIWKLAKVNFGS